VLKAHFESASWGAIRKLVATGKVQVNGVTITESGESVSPGALIAVRMSTPRRKPGVHTPDERVLHCDPHLVVVNKPIGISSVDHERESTSLQSQVRDWLRQKEKRPIPPLKVVHRLDKVTSGVMLFARTAAVQSELKQQFRAHTTGRYYRAVAHGAVQDVTLKYRLVRDRGDGIRGVTRDPNLGQHSVTHVSVTEHLGRCSLIECRLETGRTHQIRIHLAETGHPLVGDPLYGRGASPAGPSCERTLLHAAFLSFTHPVFRKRCQYEEPLPQDFAAFLDAERARGR
jgi:23S rRNA pseudouridine1911/1915/1917 synthase